MAMGTSSKPTEKLGGLGGAGWAARRRAHVRVPRTLLPGQLQLRHAPGANHHSPPAPPRPPLPKFADLAPRPRHPPRAGAGGTQTPFPTPSWESHPDASRRPGRTPLLTGAAAEGRRSSGARHRQLAGSALQPGGQHVQCDQDENHRDRWHIVAPWSPDQNAILPSLLTARANFHFPQRTYA